MIFWLSLHRINVVSAYQPSVCSQCFLVLTAPVVTGGDSTSKISAVYLEFGPSSGLRSQHWCISCSGVVVLDRQPPVLESRFRIKYSVCCHTQSACSLYSVILNTRSVWSRILDTYNTTIRRHLRHLRSSAISHASRGSIGENATPITIVSTKTAREQVPLALT